MAITVLQEDFDSFTDWTLSGAPTARSGRTGLGIQTTSTNTATYTIPGGSESATVIVGCAWFCTSITSNRPVFSFKSDTAATTHLTLVVNTSGALEIRRGTVSGTVLATSAASTIAVSTYYYVEVRVTLGDSPNGHATVRVNGTQVAAAANVDTKNAGTKTTIDAVALLSGTGNTNGYDDLYIITGSDGTFQGDQRFGTGPNDIVHEPFNTLWTIEGNTPPPTITAGRHGNGLQLGGNGSVVGHTITVPSYFVVVGFALRLSGGSITSTGDFVALREGGTQRSALRCTTTGVLQLSTAVAPTSAGTVAVDGVWRYVEFSVLAAATGGAATIRVNDSVVGGPAFNASTSTGIPALDEIRIAGIPGVTTTQIDDLYILTGTLADFEGDQTVVGAAVLNVWDGAAFESAPVLTWNGSAFVDAVTITTWNGSSFV